MATCVWPNLNCVLSVTTGSFAFYAEKLRHYISDSVPFYSPIYGVCRALQGERETVSNRCDTE